MRTLTELAEEALVHAKRLDAYTISKGLPPASIDQDTLTTAGLSPDLQALRQSLADSCQWMRRLALGPEESMLEILFSFTDILSLQVVYEYDLAGHVPLDGTISYLELAEASSLPEPLCRRFLVHAMENGIFAEEAGAVRHSALSRMLVLDRESLAAAGFISSDLAPSSLRVVDAIRRYPGSGEPNETGFNIENNTNLPYYTFLAQNPERMKRFGTGMQFFSRGGALDLQHLVNGYPWKSIDHPGAVVVDLGGGLGTVSKGLAAATENIKFVVQDLAGPVKIGRETLPSDLKGRVEYAEADFFADQPIIGADVYFFRWILHNWSDEYSVKILRSLVPAMKKGSKVVVFEYVLAESPQLTRQAKMQRNLDMIMLTVWNACERTARDWKALFRLVDERFAFKGTTCPDGSRMSVIEVEWRGEDV